MSQKNPLNVLKKYFTQKEYLLIFIGSLVAIVLQNLSNLFIPKIVSNSINEFQQTLAVSNTFYILIGIILVVMSGLSLLQNYLFAILGEKVGNDLRNRLVSKVLEQDYNYLVKENPSKILTVILSDVNYIKTTLFQTVTLLITGVILLIGSVIMMFSLNARLATYIVVTVPLLAILLLLFLKNRFVIFKEVQKIRDGLNKIINENIKASMLIRVFVAEKTEIKKFKQQNTKSKNLGIEITKLFALVIPSISLISYICTILIIYIGGKEVIFGRLQVGDITAFNLYVMMFTMPLISLSFMTTLIGQAMASLQRINDIMYKEKNFVDGKEITKAIDSIDIKNLNFIDEETPVLENINFELKKGQKIGIMGLTGSGKTLFLKHLIRAVEPTSGEIMINKKDIKTYKVDNLRQNIGFCFQDNFLINDTIYENIRFGREVDEKEVMRVARIANVDEFVKKFDKGYKTLAGEKGNNLSGGQKQRVMIARALIGSPSLLIFDDITSRLDANTENLIFGNIRKNYPDTSMILVSQKISSLKDCNQIYIFDEGIISESGTHEELLKTSSLYKEIELSQSNYDE